MLILPCALLWSLMGCAEQETEEPAASPVAEERAEGAESVDPVAIRRGIDATNVAAEQAVAEGDVAGFVERVYTEDATILPPGAQAISGRSGIEQFWSGAAEQLGLTGLDLQTQEVVPLGQDMAYEVGRAAIETTGGAQHANYVVIWRRGQDGQWRWHVDIWNEMPQPSSDG